MASHKAQMILASQPLAKEVWAPGQADWQGNSLKGMLWHPVLSEHSGYPRKLSWSPLDHLGQVAWSKQAPGGAGPSKADPVHGRKQSFLLGALTVRTLGRGESLFHSPWSSESETALSPRTGPFFPASSSPTSSRRVFIMPASPILESQQASVCGEQETVMVTARQPAGSWPSLQPTAAPLGPCPRPAPQPKVQCFYPWGSWEKRSVSPPDTFKRKWRRWVQGGTIGEAA